MTTKTDLVHALDTAFTSSVLAYEEDRTKRTATTTRPHVIAFTGSYEVKLFPQGSVMLIVAPEGSSALESLRAAIAADDAKAMHAAAKTLDAGRDNLKVVPADQAAKALIAADTYGELYYGNSLLAAGVLIGDVPSSAMILPYAGGELHDASFEFVQYQRSSSSRKLTALVITAAPSLTAAEMAAMNDAPPEARVGAAGVTVTPMCTPAALVACLTPGVLVAVVGTLLTGMKRDTANVPAEMRSGLSPSATARELIDLRRRALTG